MKISHLSVLCLCVSTFSAIQLQYLKKTFRFNDPSLVDYYFSCSAVGETLQWRVNQLGLGGYVNGSRTGDILFSSRSNYTYTTTLLSSVPAPEPGHLQFDSILIVFLPGESYLDVVCRTESAENSTNNQDTSLSITTILKEIKNDSISLTFILTKNVIQSNPGLNTSIFVCGVQGSYLRWQVNKQQYGFGTGDTIGANNRILFSVQGHNTVEEQAIFIAQQPYQYVSVLFVTNTSDVNVTCGSDGESVELSTRLDFNSPTSIATTTEYISGSESPVDETMNLTMAEVIGAVTASLLFLLLLLLTVLMVIVAYLHKRRKKLEKETSSYGKAEENFNEASVENLKTNEQNGASESSQIEIES